MIKCHTEIKQNAPCYDYNQANSVWMQLPTGTEHNVIADV